MRLFVEMNYIGTVGHGDMQRLINNVETSKG
jgi:hypothetical protein